MLTSTFIHIPCVGKRTEEQLWQQDIRSWDAFRARIDSIPLTETKRNQIIRYIELSEAAIAARDHAFFMRTLPNSLHWRAYPHFRERCAFLDIETTGLDRVRNEITVIGLYDGVESSFFIQGINLDDFREEIKKYNMIITFNGRCFDVPFILSAFEDLEIDAMHIDLRFLLRALGYFGGLKLIEKQLGIARDDTVAEIDGYEAVRLWKRYRAGDRTALKTLVEYNRADIENLQILMDIAYQEAKSSLF